MTRALAQSVLIASAFFAGLVPAACGDEDSPAPPATVPAGDASKDSAPRVDAGDQERGADAATADAAVTDAIVPDVGDAADKADVPKGPFSCARDTTFPAMFSVAEASGAAEVELTPGVRELLVVSDSGHSGAAMLYHLGTGATRTITLPLDALASDDLEGIAWRSGKLYTITSSGFVRRFAPNGTGGLTRDQDAYAVGASPYACADPKQVNCGKDYEGLCLRAPTSTSPCAGYAASKSEGKLYCLTLDASGVLAVNASVPPITLGLGADKVSDCAFGAAGGAGQDALVVTSNLYNLSRSYRVNEATGGLTQLPSATLLNNEAIAIDSAGYLYVFDDNSSGTSTASRDACKNW